MDLPKTLVAAKFLRRLNRFAVVVRLPDGTVVEAHLPNSGRLQEVLRPDNEVWLVPRSGRGRRTAYDVLLAQDGETLVCLDARLPPQLLLEGIYTGKVQVFGKVLGVQPEIAYGNHRLDLCLQVANEPPSYWLVETKSVTLVVKGVALFPDAPTVRGQRHLRLLTALRREGIPTAVVFIVQRPDAKSFHPHEFADPAFARHLREAAQAGVLVRAYACSVTLREIRVVRPIPVRL